MPYLDNQTSYVTDAGEAQSWSPSKLPPLTPAADLAVARQTYPDGLWCTSPRACPHRVLATTAGGWAKSSPRPDRETFVCKSCRLDAEERARVGAALTAAKEAKKAEYAPAVERPVSALRGRRLKAGYRDDRPAGPRLGGRPRKHAATDLAQRRAAADRAKTYRQNRKAAQAAANDALLAGGA
jgi:hypothetical protein